MLLLQSRVPDHGRPREGSGMSDTCGVSQATSSSTTTIIIVIFKKNLKYKACVTCCVRQQTISNLQMDLHNKTHAPQMPPFTADVDAQQNVSGETQPVSIAEMQHLIDGLQSILKIIEERDTALQDSITSLVDKLQWLACTNRRSVPYRVAPANDY